MIRKLSAIIVLFLLPNVLATTYYLQILNPNDYDLTDFQIKINLTQYNISAPVAQITTLNGTDIPFCYEQPNGECNQTESNIIWMKVPLIKGKDYTTIKIISNGSNGAVNGDQVFDLYDDFNDGVIGPNKWGTKGTYFESGGLVCLQTSDSTFPTHIYSLTTFNKPFVVEARTKIGTSEAGNPLLVTVSLGYEPGSYANHYFNPGVSAYLRARGFEGPNTVVDEIVNDGNFHVLGILVDDTGFAHFTVDGTRYEDPDAATQTGPFYITFLETWETSLAYTSYCADWIRVRKYADQDPIIKAAYSQSSLFPQSPAQTATEYNQTYLYVRQVNVLPENPISVSNTPVVIELNTTKLISEGKMKSDCSDIYVTYYDPLYGEVPAKFWVDPTTCNTGRTKIYVKLPVVSINNDYIVNVYYGSPNAIPMWDPKNTFSFYVDLTNPSDISQNLIIRTEGTTTLDYTSSGLRVTTDSDGKVLIVNK